MLRYSNRNPDLFTAEVPEIDAFLADIRAICLKHGMVLSAWEEDSFR